MEPEEDFGLLDLISDDSDEDFDPYAVDPTFGTKEELDKFLHGCDLQKDKSSDSEDTNFEEYRSVKKVCSCGKCGPIFSGEYEHICCHQTNNWRKFVSDEESKFCIIHAEAFNQATNYYAVRNLLLHLNRKKELIISDPPSNRQMRYGFYKASIQFIGKGFYIGIIHL